MDIYELQQHIREFERAATAGTVADLPAETLRAVLDAAKAHAVLCPWCATGYWPRLSCTNCGR